MERKAIIRKLNWFYSLEHNQVNLYMTQSKQTDDLYIKRVFNKAATIEQRHIDLIGAKIEELGGRPTLLGNILGSLSGRILGEITEKMDMVKLLSLNVKLEEKAMQDYKKFISQIDDQALSKLLWSNLIDEDLHASWFASKIDQLRQDK